MAESEELVALIENRRQKLELAKSSGLDPYPARVDYDLEPTDAVARFGDIPADQLVEIKEGLRVPGRIGAIRRHGKLVFLDLSDGRSKLQLMLSEKELGSSGWWLFNTLDIGDIVLAAGHLMRTRAGELTLRTNALTLLAKALRPLPEKWHGLTDVEARYRQRYLDLLLNQETRQTFEIRAKILKFIRTYLDSLGFIEVETPIMQQQAGGAIAKPFRTFHNALGMDLYLRVAPELYLKRLVVGGLHRVYELGRNFRNEGLSTRHNPEFTMLEFYQAYANYEVLMETVEDLISSMSAAILGQDEALFNGHVVQLRRPWQRIDMRQAIVDRGAKASSLDSAETLREELRRRGVDSAGELGSYGTLLTTLFEKFVEPQLVGPVFITGHPVETSPLAKSRLDDPRFTERFELYMGGIEVANGFSELNDPVVQEERFLSQAEMRVEGTEGQTVDHDYLVALQHGLPPTGGAGVGVDRLTMLLSNRESIREVILFPVLRPEGGRPLGHSSNPLREALEAAATQVEDAIHPDV